MVSFGRLAEWSNAPHLFPIFLTNGVRLENRNPAHGGGVAEWFKAAVLKTAVPERAP